MTMSRSLIAFWSFILLVIKDCNVYALKDVSVKIPLAVTPGDTVTLVCQYNMESDPLYSVKWYKGRQEFFRYIPKELPHTKVFPQPNVIVDTTRSGAHEVVLKNVQYSMAGKYRCEVSADAPSFHTTMVSAYMYVVYLPETEPSINVAKQRYSIGETLSGNCSTPAANPPANLTWVVNGKPVGYSYMKRIPIENDRFLSDNTFTSTPSEPIMSSMDNRRQTTTVGIELELTPDHFLANKLRLDCVATVLHLYKKTSLLIIEEEKPRLASVLSTRDTNSSTCTRVNYLAIIAIISIWTIGLR